MSDDNKNAAFSVNITPPSQPLLKLQKEVSEIESELLRKLKKLEREWGVEVQAVQYTGDDVLIRCEVVNLKDR